MQIQNSYGFTETMICIKTHYNICISFKVIFLLIVHPIISLMYYPTKIIYSFNINFIILILQLDEYLLRAG